MPNLIILDVGHGNCAVIRDEEHIIVVDCASGATLIDLLVRWGVRDVPFVLISHADEDHIAGVTTLLLNQAITVGRVYLNSDSKKRTAIWDGLRRALADARRRAGTVVQVGLTPVLTGELDVGQTRVEILAPSGLLAMTGVGGQDLHGRELGANSMSAVIGLVHNSHRFALIAGDIDELGLDDLLNNQTDLQADVIVFPHHGGRPGKGDPLAFARRLSRAVKPKLVVFSNGRGRLENPQPKIVEGIKTIVPESHIMCTELSKACAKDAVLAPAHLLDLPSLGYETSSCCGGSILVQVSGRDVVYAPSIEAHRAYITKNIPTPVCLNTPPKLVSS